jgi:hypothetical protein
MIFPPQRGQTRPLVVRFSTSSAKGLLSLIRVCQWFLYFRKTTKIEQNIATGGANNTSTPMLKLRINLELVALVKALRHIEHCAPASLLARSTTPTTTTTKTKTRHQFDFITAPPLAPARLADSP